MFNKASSSTENEHSHLDYNISNVFKMQIWTNLLWFPQVALRAHMKNEHPHENFSGQFFFQCEICKINFADVEDIRKHMVKVHPDCQTLFCSVSGCGHMVNNNEALIDHVRKKHTRSNKDCWMKMLNHGMDLFDVSVVNYWGLNLIKMSKENSMFIFCSNRSLLFQ